MPADEKGNEYIEGGSFERTSDVFGSAESGIGYTARGVGVYHDGGEPIFAMTAIVMGEPLTLLLPLQAIYKATEMMKKKYPIDPNY